MCSFPLKSVCSVCDSWDQKAASIMCELVMSCNVQLASCICRALGSVCRESTLPALKGVCANTC